MTHRHDILNAIKARLVGITVANGYATDVGQRISYGVQIADDPAVGQLPMGVFVAGAVEPIGDLLGMGDISDVQMEVAIVGATTVDDADELTALETLLADFEKAIFSTDDQLGGKVSSLKYAGDMLMDRQEGDKVGRVGMKVLVQWKKRIGFPDF